eukprot:gene23819-30906_t
MSTSDADRLCYEKQVRWKRAAAAKVAERIKEEMEISSAQQNTFTPTIYSSSHRPTTKVLDQSATKLGNEPGNYTQQVRYNEQVLPILSDESPEIFPHKEDDDNDPSIASSFSSINEPIVELLERERRQWQSERERLIQCIHLQQLELSQRSIAAHERAADIAQEFAKAIEMFEERLVTVETNVQKEIMSIRGIAESI